MTFTNNELFLITIICILCIIIGALFYYTYSQYKKFKLFKQEMDCFTYFINKVFDNIAFRENVDIKKYIELTHQQINSTKEGGDN